MSSYGAPVLHGAVAHVHCRAQEVVEAGDHLSCCARSRRMEVARPVTPLLFFQGGYGGFSPKGMAAKGDAEVIAAVRRAEVSVRRWSGPGRDAAVPRLPCSPR